MELVLHIGAHRTGSTWIERSIAASIAKQAALTSADRANIGLWPPRFLRDIKGFQSAFRDFHAASDRAAALRFDALAARIASALAAEAAQGTTRLILSEENLIGGMRQNFETGQFYPMAEARLHCHGALFPRPNMIALGLRDYGAVWTSAFHYLPQTGHKQAPAAQACTAMMEDDRGWPALVDAVKQAWPGVPILVWDHADLAQYSARICARMTGLSANEIALPDGHINARTKPGTALFTKAQNAVLAERYAHDLAVLRADPALSWPNQRAAA